MSAPSDTAYAAAIRVVDYLRQPSQRLCYRAIDSPKLTCFSDANWASDSHSNRKSTSGSMVFVYGCLVSWKSQVQRCVALSAVEAEFLAGSEASRELLFVRYLLRDLDIPMDTPAIVTNSQGCVDVSKDQAQHWKLKHIDTRYHHLREMVQGGDLTISYERSAANPADVLTKPVGKHSLTKHCGTMGLVVARE